MSKTIPPYFIFFLTSQSPSLAGEREPSLLQKWSRIVHRCPNVHLLSAQHPVRPLELFQLWLRVHLHNCLRSHRNIEDLVGFFSYFMSTLVCLIEFTFKKLPNPTRIWVPPSLWRCPISSRPLPSPPCLLLWKSDTQFWEEGPWWPKGHPA